MSSAQPLRPPLSEVNTLPPLLDFKYPKTRIQVYTHRSFHARPTAVFEDPPDDIAPDNEVLEFLGDSVLSLAVATLVRSTYPGLRVGPHAKIRALVVQNATIAQISRHYRLADNLRANNSQIVNLRHSTSVQADLFEAYIGGLHADWGYEHIRPWLFRVLRPYIDEAYRVVQKDYLEPGGKGPRSPPTTISHSPASAFDGRAYTSGSPLRHSPHQSIPSISSLSPHRAGSSPLTDANLAAHDPSIQRTKTVQGYITPATTTIAKFTSSRSSESVSSTNYRPSSSAVEAPQFSPSVVAEGHLPLLNQVLQLGKRWIDWEYERDPIAPITTPIWTATGKMSGVMVCQGRGNTKKLAKSEAARSLVTDLQSRLGKKACTTANLAKEMERWWVAKQFEQPIYEEGEDTIISSFDKINLNQDSKIHVPPQMPEFYFDSQLPPYH
ncbi:hypothetical protein FS842_004510 [Serendipita sp. 407]|nr:hypothetical protein FS842_004510 [Serendipita sp. 407]